MKLFPLELRGEKSWAIDGKSIGSDPKNLRLTTALASGCLIIEWEKNKSFPTAFYSQTNHRDRT